MLKACKDVKMVAKTTLQFGYNKQCYRKLPVIKKIVFWFASTFLGSNFLGYCKSQLK
jgi:hypothetical protein